MNGRNLHAGFVPALPPRPRVWWEYAKWAGVLAANVPLLSTEKVLGGVALHVVCDFTLQSPWMAAGKAKGEVAPLVVHSLVAGAVPGFYVGGLLGAVVGFLSHLAIDSTRKFGLAGWPGIVLDQLTHIAVLLVLGVIQ